jgi:pyruvate dehydrogenase E2 component (dihydrolipoamide acetyltransferase)
MPQLSDTMTEGTLVKWHKKVGDKIKAGDKIADVETDKAVMEWEAYDEHEGTLAKIVVNDGQKVKIGSVLAIVAGKGESVDDAAKSSAATKTTDAPAETKKTPEREDVAAPIEFKPEPAKVGAPEPAVALPGSDRVRVSPLASRLAAEKGVDLSQVKGTGPGGRIVQKDILSFTPTRIPPSPGAAIQQTKQPAAVPVLPSRVASGSKETVQLSKMRSVIAQRLQQSKQQIPHFYETVDIDMEAIVALRERMNEQLKKNNIRLSVADFIAKAVSATLLQHKTVNSHFNGTDVTTFGDVHLGMAVALDNGLIVPVLRNINQMGLAEIRVRSADLVDRARAQKLKQDELTGATFTVSNLGTYGVREFSAIINPPEVGILAIGAAEQRAVVRNGQIVPRTIMSVTLSADHRIVDGALAAEFLRTLKQNLGEPGMMLV